MMTIVRAASSAMLSGALVPRRAAVPLEVALPRVPLQEEVLRGEAHPRVRLREILAVAAVAPAATMTSITTHRAAEAEAAEGNGYVEDMDSSSPSTDGAALFFGSASRGLSGY